MNKVYFVNSEYTQETGVGPWGKNTTVVKIARGPQREGGIAEFETKNIVWAIPNVGRPGQRYQFNLMVQYDEDACVPVSGDSVGVTIKLFNDVLPRTAGETDWMDTRLRGGTSLAEETTGDNLPRGNSHWDWNSAGIVLGAAVKTDAREDAGEWQHIRCDVPAGDGDVLYIIFWVGTDLCGNGVRAAYPSLYLYDSHAPE